MMTRHSTMIVGPTNGGKTVVIDTLVKAQCRMGLPTTCVTLNPKVNQMPNSPETNYFQEKIGIILFGFCRHAR